MEQQVVEAGQLDPGTREFPFELKLPDSVAPSYLGRICSARYFVRLRLDHWLASRRATYEVFVRPPNRSGNYPGKARVFSCGELLKGSETAFEGSLASEVLLIGGELSGALALLNTEFHGYSKAGVALVATERIHGRGRREAREVDRISLSLPIEDLAKGDSVPLRFELPGGLSPSIDTALWSLRWELEVAVRPRLGREKHLRVPVEVVSGDDAAASPDLAEPPKVGSARRMMVWQAVAEELGLQARGQTLALEKRGGLSLDITGPWQEGIPLGSGIDLSQPRLRTTDCAGPANRQGWESQPRLTTLR